MVNGDKIAKLQKILAWRLGLSRRIETRCCQYFLWVFTSPPSKVEGVFVFACDWMSVMLKPVLPEGEWKAGNLAFCKFTAARRWTMVGWMANQYLGFIVRWLVSAAGFINAINGPLWQNIWVKFARTSGIGKWESKNYLQAISNFKWAFESEIIPLLFDHQENLTAKLDWLSAQWRKPLTNLELRILPKWSPSLPFSHFHFLIHWVLLTSL